MSLNPCFSPLKVPNVFSNITVRASYQIAGTDVPVCIRMGVCVYVWTLYLDLDVGPKNI
jgi:hypothetical protein